MEKIFQILAVFALLMLAITYFIRGRESRYRQYVPAGRLTFPLFPGAAELLSAMEVAEDNENELFFRAGPDRQLEIIDRRTEEPVPVPPLQVEVDVILFDRGTRLLYCCAVTGRVTVVRQLARDNYRIMQEMPVPPDVTSFSLDPQNGKLYVRTGSEVSVYSPS